MSLLTIIEYPDPRLHRVARPVTAFDARLRQLVADMAQTMYAAPGIGLAATQVDVHEQLIVLDISEARDQLQVFVNPQIVSIGDDLVVSEEGCLSVPGVYDEVQRPARVRVRAQDVDGAAFERDCDGMLAVCVQHEVDHLRGKVFVEYLSPLKRVRIATRLRKRKAKLHA